jgi:hypothetical protein
MEELMRLELKKVTKIQEKKEITKKEHEKNKQKILIGTNL